MINILTDINSVPGSGGTIQISVIYENTPVSGISSAHTDYSWIDVEATGIYPPTGTTDHTITYTITIDPNTSDYRTGSVVFRYTDASANSYTAYMFIHQGTSVVIKTSIFKDTFFEAYGSSLIYSIVYNGEPVFNGKTFRNPDDPITYINVAKIARDYIYQSLGDFREYDGDVISNEGGSGMFSLVNEFGAALANYEFLYQYDGDWSGETGYNMSEPVNGHISPYMKLMVTQYDGLDNWILNSKRDLHPEEYLTFNVLSGGYILVYSFAYAPAFWYSINGGDWVYKARTSGGVSRTFRIYVKPGDKVRVKSNFYTTFYPSIPSARRIIMFYNSTASYYLTGNIKSLTQEDNFMDDYYANSSSTSVVAFNYIGLFEDVGLVDASQLVMPEYVWKKNEGSSGYSKKSGVYQSMFNSCTNLVYPPLLPAKELEQACYIQMFSNCRSLLVPPILSVPEPEPGYYYAGICAGCTSLISQLIIPQ